MAQDSQLDLWEVFIQTKVGGHHTHAGSVHASDRKMAIQNARDTYIRRGEAFSIWVVPSNALVASNRDDNDSLFESQYDKIYRNPTFYTMPEGAKNI